jgi:plastocyanin
MRVRHLAALGAGLFLAFAVARFPAFATGQSIAAVDHTAWMPQNVTIDVGDTVTWTNGTGFSHNVCVRRSNASGCGEYRNGSASATWPAEGYTHQFTSDGTFSYRCEIHAAMTGTITVGTGVNPPTGTGTGTGTGTSTGTGTGTSTTPPPNTQPTDTITVPTQTQTTTTNSTDTTKPGFTGVVKRRASRKALIVQLGSTEDATLKTTVFRRPPGRRAFTRVGQASQHVTQGRNVVTVSRKAGGRLRSGSYRVTLQLVDAAGNKSATKTLSFKLA